MSGPRSDGNDQAPTPPARAGTLESRISQSSSTLRLPRARMSGDSFGSKDQPFAKAAAWLQDQLVEERKEQQKRHDALVRGLELVLSQGAQAKNLEDEASESKKHDAEEKKNEDEEVTIDLDADVIGEDTRTPSRTSNQLTPNQNLRSSTSGSKSFSNGGLRHTQELTNAAIQDRGLHLHHHKNSRVPTLSEDYLRRADDTAVMRAFKTTRVWAGGLVTTDAFDYCMGLVIVANCVTIGMEVELSIESPSSDVLKQARVLEHVFLAIYVLELGVRLLAGGTSCFGNHWFQLDFLLVLLGVVSFWVLEPAVKIGGGYDLLEKVLFIRILRVIRLVRALRFLKFMMPLWKLVSGIAGSLRTVISAAFLLFGAIYVFACAGVALLGQDDDLLSHSEAGPIVQNHFTSIPLLMMTLVEFTASDSGGGIYQPLIRAKPILVLYFLPILLVIPISLMNLITAVIVDHAIQCSMHDAELERCRLRGKLKNLIPLLNKMFQEFDLSCTGEINLAELDLTRMSMPLPPEVLEVLKSHKLKDFFNLLDADASGRIDQTEWVDGMCCLVLNEVPIENLQMLHLLRRQAHDVEAIKTAVVPEADRSDEYEEGSFD